MLFIDRPLTQSASRLPLLCTHRSLAESFGLPPQMTAPTTTMNTVNDAVSSLSTTAIDALSTASSAALSALPAFVQSFVHTAFFTAQSLLAERWEVRALAIFLMLPTALLALIAASIAVALLWPFTFLAATVGGLAFTANYLFWPTTSDLKTSAALPIRHSQPSLRSHTQLRSDVVN